MGKDDIIWNSWLEKTKNVFEIKTDQALHICLSHKTLRYFSLSCEAYSPFRRFLNPWRPWIPAQKKTALFLECFSQEIPFCLRMTKGNPMSHAERSIMFTIQIAHFRFGASLSYTMQNMMQIVHEQEQTVSSNVNYSNYFSRQSYFGLSIV